MNKEKRRVPKLRFPGFTEDWEQCKLSDILVERNEQQVETNEYPLMSFVQGYGVIPKGERYDRSFLVLDQSKKYKRTELGDFIYSSNNLETGSIGINKTGKAVISPVYSIFYGVSIGDSQFIGIMSLLPRFIAKMIRFRQGVVYGQWRIHEKDFLDISILIPSVDERTKITKLILSLEELITLHQRKLEHLKLKKKALLQKLFPKNGERYPELRFPGFTDAWEQRKLEDVCNVYDGTHQTPRYTNSGVMFVSVEDIETLESNKYITEEDFKSEFKVFPEYGDILLTRIGDVGSANVILDEIKRAYYVSLALLKPKDINSLFLLALLSSSSVQSEIWRRTLHIAFPKKINKNEINKVIVNQPSIPEQKKIGKLFFSLDQTITLHQRELDHLQLQKKALLQQMFV